MTFSHVPGRARFAGLALALALALALLPIGCSGTATLVQTEDAGQTPVPDASLAPNAACVAQDETVGTVLSGLRTSPVLSLIHISEPTRPY